MTSLEIQKRLEALKPYVIVTSDSDVPDPLAQLVERLVWDQRVAGSSPASPTNFSQKEAFTA